MPVSRATPAPRTTGAFASVSRGLGAFRWAFMPLGLLALLAVGVHAAADTVCDRLLWATDRVAEAFDHLVATFDLTSPLVGAISFAARTRVARGAALVWELAADVVIALPALGYRDPQKSELLRAPDGWRSMLRRIRQRPTTLRIARPLETAAFALAGACGVAKMVQGAVYLDLHDLLGDGGAAPFAKFVALLVLASVGLALGLRALIRSLEHADERSEEEARSPSKRFTVGLVGSALCLPLALAAILDASPLLAFFR